MQNWERSEFDEQWKDAFAGAEVAPSASVWANVDRELTLADNNEGKRRIIFYQRLAAACVLFAVMAGGFGVYYWKQSEISVAQLNLEKSPQTTNQSESSLSKENVLPQNQSAQSTNASKEDTIAQLNPSKAGDAQSKSSGNEATVLSPSQNSDVTNSSPENTAAQINSGKITETTIQSKSSVDKNASSPSQASMAANTSTEIAAAQSNSEKADEIKSQLKSSTNENSLLQQPPTKNSTAEGNTQSIARSQNNVSAIASTTSRPKEKILGDENTNTISTATKNVSQNETRFASSVDLPALELLPIAEIEGEPRVAEIYRRLPYIPASFMNMERDKKFEHEKLWASVSAASGSYTDMTGGSSYSSAAMRVMSAGLPQSSPPLTNNLSYSGQGAGSVPTVGKSYSYGVIGGVRLAERWVLQTGVQYMNQSIGNSSSQYMNYGSGSPISTNEFVSVPVQAGYLLINRKIGWQLNPGVSTDFFVRNTTSNQQVSVTQGAGTDSPYRSVSFAGLMSSEFSYKLGKNYRLSLVPGMRYSLNPALKSVTTGSAIAWDIGFRFRYILK